MKKLIAIFISLCMLGLGIVPVDGANNQPKFARENFYYATAILDPGGSEEEPGFPQYYVDIVKTSQYGDDYSIMYSSTTFDGRWYTATYAFGVISASQFSMPKRLGSGLTLQVNDLMMDEEVYTYELDKDMNVVPIDDNQPVYQQRDYDFNLSWQATNVMTYFVNNHFSWSGSRQLVYKEKSLTKESVISGYVNDVDFSGAYGAFGTSQSKIPYYYEEESSGLSTISKSANNSMNSRNHYVFDMMMVDGFWYPVDDEGNQIGAGVYLNLSAGASKKDDWSINIYEDITDGKGNVTGAKLFYGTISSDQISVSLGTSASVSYVGTVTGSCEIYYYDQESSHLIPDVAMSVNFDFLGSFESSSRAIVKNSDYYGSYQSIQRYQTYSGTAQLNLNGNQYGPSNYASAMQYYDHQITK